MTHELKKLVQAYIEAQELSLKSVLVTVVALEGSSYRKPGVRMLVLENGKMIGAVSGGCVEKEILLQAQSVFKTTVAKVMTYDGRYRLGCEGVLYILLEPFQPSPLFIETFANAVKNRESFKISSFFKKEQIDSIGFGTKIQFQNISLPVSLKHALNTELLVFEERMSACFRLVIFGSEHDAVILCSMANIMGWEVVIYANPLEEKTMHDFPGSTHFHAIAPEMYVPEGIDKQTAIVVMNHSYAKDLLFLIALKHSNPSYIGILGPAHRREKLLNELIEKYPEVSDNFINFIYGPAGLNIGSVTPQEIAVAILAEILTVTRNEKPMFLRDKENSFIN